MTQSRKILFYSLVLLVGLLMAVPAIVNGQSAAEWIIGSEPVTVGDPVNLTLSVNHPAETQVLFPDLAEAWPEATIAKQAIPETVSECRWLFNNNTSCRCPSLSRRANLPPHRLRSF